MMCGIIVVPQNLAKLGQRGREITQQCGHLDSRKFIFRIEHVKKKRKFFIFSLRGTQSED